MRASAVCSLWTFFSVLKRARVHTQTAAEVEARTISSQTGAHVAQKSPGYSEEEPEIGQENEEEEEPLLPLIQDD